MEIGYPELAVGDAYKATLLFDEIHNDSSLGSTALLMFGMKHWLSMDPLFRDATQTNKNFQANVWAVLTQIEINNTKLLVEALIHLDCPCDAQEICRDASRRFPAEGYFRGTKSIELNERKKTSLAWPMPSHFQSEQYDDWVATLRYGAFYRRAYPWMSSEMLRRDHFAINTVRKLVASLTPKCDIEKISAKGGPNKTKSDYYGMVAKTGIRKGNLIFQEGTVICAARPSTGRCPSCCSLI